MNVILGITGSIAAYKAAELASLLVKKEYAVHVIMTPAAARFITPLTLQAISQHPVYVDMFDSPGSWEIGHISLARRADLILVAPATADFIARMAAGMADDLLAATILAARAPVLLAPAMNDGMYANPVLQEKIAYLKRFGYHFIDPESGRLACGTVGQGRLAEPARIASAVEQFLSTSKVLAGKRILVTAGPTREPLDPVRFLSNYSSGKMGYAIAREARRRGADVALVSGPTQLAPPAGVELIPVETAQEMFEAVVNRYDQADIVIKAAAVSDFRPQQRAGQKLKKLSAQLVLELERTPDILQYLGQHKQGQILVGFAAETEDLLVNAGDKLKQKHLDLVIANNLAEPGAGFGVDTNLVTLLYSNGDIIKLPMMPKVELAGILLDKIAVLCEHRRDV
ncbi:MAG: bifunctional phosphopantothenoylcysteine decarboxylase/phosphopantothenate--cysteine ligase CoaBC [Thermacetogeniaceae bacterium]